MKHKTTNRYSRLALITLALIGTMSFSSAQEEKIQESEAAEKLAQAGKLPTTVFITGCGDLNQKYDSSSGSPDISGSYAPWPPSFPLTIPGQSLGGLDQTGANKRRNFHLAGYPAFNASQVVEATLRTDVFMPMNMSNGNDTLTCYNDSNNTSVAIGSQLYGISLTKWLASKGVKKGEWVSVVVNLSPNGTGGGIYVYGINGFGNPIPGKYYGLYTTISMATRAAVLVAASDGDLQGVVQDDTPTSYVELHVKAF